MARDKPKKKIDTAGEEAPLTASPFASLGGLRQSLPQGEQRLPEVETDQPPASRPPPPRRAVVRFTRKGRGGKEVTLVQHLGLPPDELDRWLSQLKRALGCGGVREEDQLVFQGDQRDRLPRLLKERGVKKVSVS